MKILSEIRALEKKIASPDKRVGGFPYRGFECKVWQKADGKYTVYAEDKGSFGEWLDEDEDQAKAIAKSKKSLDEVLKMREHAHAKNLKHF